LKYCTFFPAPSQSLRPAVAGRRHGATVPAFKGGLNFWKLSFQKNNMKRHKLRKLNKFLFLCLALCLIFYCVSFFKLKIFPDQNEIHPDLFNDPIQIDSAQKEPFVFNYANEEYRVKPIASYELWGLVVSHNDIKKWYNMYHDENSVNIKDLCVVWGENISSGIYRKMKFKNGEFTCYGDWGESSREEVKKFRNNSLSNNHLIASKENVRKIIRDIKIGDQIHLKGMLSSYGKTETPEKYYRSSSLRRDDTGSGACETVFVEEIEILKKGMDFWYQVRDLSLYGFCILILLKFVLFIYEALR
jgi:hypothetical protein